MKSKLCGVLASMLLLAGASSASEPRPTAKISPLGECLVANHVTAWGVVHDQRLVVKSLGNRYYDIELRRGCPKLERELFLSFRNGLTPMQGDHGKQLICGEIGDAVKLTRGIRGTNHPCPISGIRRIDEATFEAVFGADPASADEMLDRAADRSGQRVASND